MPDRQTALRSRSLARRAFPGRLSGLAGLLLAAACGGDSGVAGVLVVASIEVAPPNSAVITGQTLQLSAIPKTEGGIILPARDVVWASTNEGTATVSDDGLVRAVNVGGPVLIRATMAGVTGETQVTVIPVPVDHVVVTPPATGLTVGQSAQLTATAFDVLGAPLVGRSFSWTTSDPATVAVTTTGMVIGLAPGGPVDITATSEAKAGTARVTVSPRLPSRLAFLQQPTNTVAGALMAPPVRVAIQDDIGGTVTSAGHSVTIALGTNPGGATLSGTLTAVAVGGIASFPNLSLNRSGAGYTLVASGTGLASATSVPFTVIAGSGSQLGFTTAPPVTARSGVAFTASPVIQIRDAAGNNANIPGVVITASASPTGATLGGTAVATTNAGGAATFTGLSISGPVGPYSLIFSATGLPSLGSATIALTAGNPAALVITTQPPAAAKSGIVMSRQPVVRLLDAAGNPILQAGTLITAAVASGPAGGALTGTTSVSTNASGIGTWTNLGLTGPAGSYTLRFSSAGLPVATSNIVILGAGSGSTLALVTQPSASVVNGVRFPQQPAVQLRDAAGNPVSLGGVLITTSIQSGAGVLSGTTSVATNASGRASFSTLVITGVTGSRTLLFAAPGYVSIASTPIVVTAGPPNRLAMTVQPSTSAQNGVPFPTQPAVQLQDVSGNFTAVAGVFITASIFSGTGALEGTLTATTDGTGRAVFSNLSLTGKTGTFRLAFSAAGLTAATSSNIALLVGPPVQLTITTQPGTNETDAKPLTIQPVIQLVDAGGNAAPTAGVAVTATLTACSAPATLGGSTTITTDAAGAAAFTDLVITLTAPAAPPVTCTINFSAPGMSPVTSTTITIN